MDGNPSSIHASGRNAKVAMEDARSQVAAMVGCRSSELIWTSGATEANNMVIQGLVARDGISRTKSDPRPHVIVSAVEHKAVLDTAILLAERGLCDLDLASVKSSGDLDVDHLLSLVKPHTALICVMHANNEIGTVYPVAQLARLIKDRAPGAHVHVDAVQMLGKADLTWYGASAIDSASFSAHKIGGYKGIGALYLKSGRKLSLFMAGGGQERGRRPGTENIPGIISFGLRCAQVRGKESHLAASMAAAREALIKGLKTVPGVVIHWHGAEMLPNTVHFHVDGVPGDDLLLNMDLSGIQAGNGSACSTGVARPSHVVLALGYSEWVALNSVRISFSAKSTLQDVQAILDVIHQVKNRLKSTP
jgi:cysteine desulfurase